MSLSPLRLALGLAGFLSICIANPAAAASGRSWERAALQWQAEVRFDAAANGFLEAADAFCTEGDLVAKARGFSAYSMAGDAITWTAGFGEFKVVRTQYRGLSNDTARRPRFTVTYSRMRGGGVETVNCEKE